MELRSLTGGAWSCVSDVTPFKKLQLETCHDPRREARTGGAEEVGDAFLLRKGPVLAGRTRPLPRCPRAGEREEGEEVKPLRGGSCGPNGHQMQRGVPPQAVPAKFRPEPRLLVGWMRRPGAFLEVKK